MQTQRIVLGRIKLFIKLYRWYFVFTNIMLVLIAGVLVLNSSDITSFSTLESIGVVIIFAAMGIGIGIGLLPIYLIFKRLESLIVKYVSNPQINFEQQPEIRSLKRLLIFVFVMNIIINAFPIKHPSEASMQTLLSGIENPVIMNMAKSFFYSEGFFYWYQTITSWIYVSFDGVMPLFYIVLGYCTLKINSEHKQLKEELDQVV